MACLSVLAYYAYYYGWTGQRRFTSWVGALFYYVLPAVLALSLVAALRLSPSHRINLALLLCSAGASVYALEILLTVWSSLPSVMLAEDRRARAEYARARGLEFDTRTNLNVVRDLVSQGTDAVPSLSPHTLLKEQGDGTVKSLLSINGIELLPLAGISNKLVVLCNATGRFLTYRSDDHGFNNPRPLWANVRTDVAAVGDSFVQGYCVEDNFVAVIRQRYPATLNLGIEGNGPLAILATIKEYARTVKPKVVLWFHFEGNDLTDLNRERRSPLLSRYLTKGFSQNLIARQAEIDRALLEYVDTVKDKSELAHKLDEASTLYRDPSRLRMRLQHVIKLSQIRQRLGLLYGDRTRSQPPTAVVAGPPRETDQSRMDLLYDILVEAKHTVDEWEGDLYFIYLPGWEPSGSKTASFREEVLSTATRAGLPVVDIHQSFVRHPDPLDLFPFRLPGHYNEAGNRLVAEEVLRSIKDIK